MVNRRQSPRALILSTLRSSNGPVSGDRLGEELGVSRVAVHKHVERLRQAGYGVRSDRAGYLLEDGGDFLYPWEIPSREAEIEYHEGLPSTMDRALGIAIASPGAERVVIAETQTAGRGRRDRVWESRPGGLFFTMLFPGEGILRRDRDAKDEEFGKAGRRSIARATMAASIALCEAVRDVASVEAWLQWPNDLYAGGRKLGGVLVEIAGNPESPRAIAVGVGLNARNRVPERATSLQKLGSKVPRAKILERFLEGFGEMERSTRDLAPFWNDRFIGTGARVAGRNGEKLGEAEGIDEEGRIVVQGGRGGRAYAPSEARLEGKGDPA